MVNIVYKYVINIVFPAINDALTSKIYSLVQLKVSKQFLTNYMKYFTSRYRVNYFRKYITLWDYSTLSSIGLLLMTTRSHTIKQYRRKGHKHSLFFLSSTSWYHSNKICLLSLLGRHHSLWTKCHIAYNIILHYLLFKKTTCNQNNISTTTYRINIYPTQENITVQ